MQRGTPSTFRQYNADQVRSMFSFKELARATGDEHPLYILGQKFTTQWP
jgi:hypothetical protein